MQAIGSLDQQIERKKQRSKTVYAGVILVIWLLFLALNLRHLFDPFKDYGKPLAGEPYYAIRSLNYLRHGYLSHWLGVCDNLIPHPDALSFKFTEMPAFFVVNSVAFRWFGISSSTFRVVELTYALALLVILSYGSWKLYDEKTALLATLFFLLLPVNVYLLYIAWAFLFPICALFLYGLWLKDGRRVFLWLTVAAVLLGCLHHISGFFVAPALLVHAALTRTLKNNAVALAGASLVTGAAGLAYLGQILLLGQDMGDVGAKAASESVFNLGYLRDFFFLNTQKLVLNYRGLLTLPVLAVAACWIVMKIRRRKELTAADHAVFLLLLFPSLFFAIFLGMVGSHLHFLTFFSPFLALAISRTLLEWRRKRMAVATSAALTVFLGFAVYRVQTNHDVLFWNKENERGFVLARTLREMTTQQEAIAGVPDFGHGYAALSPAFFFTLDRNYYGNIRKPEEFLEVTDGKAIRFFLFPAAGRENTEDEELGQYLRESYPSFIDPNRGDLLIFDVQRKRKE